VGDPARKKPDDLLPTGLGRRRFGRFVPPVDYPACARICGLSDWSTARRMVADISPGGLSVWLSPNELESVVVGERVYIELFLPEKGFVLPGWAAHRRVIPGEYWARRILGVAFRDSPELDAARPHLMDYLLSLQTMGAEVRS
jgi:hypothetical protein